MGDPTPFPRPLCPDLAIRTISTPLSAGYATLTENRGTQNECPAKSREDAPKVGWHPDTIAAAPYDPE
jgi:hypothetical protein